jgi:hypothetical protein
MKIAGSYTLHSLRAQVWPLIQDPASSTLKESFHARL